MDIIREPGGPKARKSVPIPPNKRLPWQSGVSKTRPLAGPLLAPWLVLQSIRKNLANSPLCAPCNPFAWKFFHGTSKSAQKTIQQQTQTPERGRQERKKDKDNFRDWSKAIGATGKHLPIQTIQANREYHQLELPGWALCITDYPGRHHQLPGAPQSRITKQIVPLFGLLEISPKPGQIPFHLGFAVAHFGEAMGFPGIDKQFRGDFEVFFQGPV